MDLKVALYNFANRFRNNKFIYNSLKPIWVKFVNRDSERQRKNFHKNGLEVIKRLGNACNQHKVIYWLDFGTLLGAIREKGFIPHDNDIDIGVRFEDREKFQKAITAAGFKLTREFIIKNEKDLVGIEQTYHYKGVLVDIFYYIYLTDKTRIIYTFTPIVDDRLLQNKAEIKKTEVPYSEPMPYLFKDVDVYIPTDFETCLKFYYGNNYMTPDPNYCSKDIVKTIQYIPREKKLAEFIQYRRLYS